MRTLVSLIAAIVFTAAGIATAAEMYKWVDENGITNYTTERPPKGRAAKPIAEDRTSTYTPEPAVTDAIEAWRQRSARPPSPPQPPQAYAPPPPKGYAPPPPQAYAPPPPQAYAPPPPIYAPPPPVYAPPQPTPRIVTSPPLVPTAPYDPCIGSSDPNCYSTTIYDSSPVFQGRGRSPVLNQPQIPPGTIAGQATGGSGVTPGLSGMTPQVAPAPAPRGSLRSRTSPPPEKGFSAQ